MEASVQDASPVGERASKARQRHVVQQLHSAVNALKEQLVLQQQRRTALTLRSLALEHLTCAAASTVLSLAVVNSGPAVAAAAAAAAASAEAQRAVTAASTPPNGTTLPARAEAWASAAAAAWAAQPGAGSSDDPSSSANNQRGQLPAAAGVLSAAAIAAAADSAIAAAAADVLGSAGTPDGLDGAATGLLLLSSFEANAAELEPNQESLVHDMAVDEQQQGRPTDINSGERRSMRRRRRRRLGSPEGEETAPALLEDAAARGSGAPGVSSAGNTERLQRRLSHQHPLVWCAQLSACISRMLPSTPAAAGGSSGASLPAACVWRTVEAGAMQWGFVLDAATGAKARGLSFEATVDTYSAFITEALVLQALVGRDLGPEVWALEARLNDGLRDGISWALGAFLWKPTLVAELATRHLLRGGPAQPEPTRHHWAECLRDAQPSARQLALLGAVRRVVRARQNALAARWRRFAAALATANSPAALIAATDGLTDVMRAWESEAAVQAVACLGILSPRQALRACVRAYPYVPLPEDLLDHAQAACDAAADAAAAAVRPAAAVAAAAAAVGDVALKDGGIESDEEAAGVTEAAAASNAPRHDERMLE